VGLAQRTQVSTRWLEPKAVTVPSLVPLGEEKQGEVYLKSAVQDADTACGAREGGLGGRGMARTAESIDPRGLVGALRTLALRASQQR
jgi:hypothetical protein